MEIVIPADGDVGGLRLRWSRDSRQKLAPKGRSTCRGHGRGRGWGSAFTVPRDLNLFGSPDYLGFPVDLGGTFVYLGACRDIR